MTSAPPTLLAARRLLLDHLGGLDPAEVGIVGDPAHRGGYHCGTDRVISGDYSVVESPRDRAGLADWACALDVGEFSVSVAGKRHDLPAFSIWLVAQCKADAADTRDIREVIYSTDGSTVRRWDRLGRRSSGDSTHRWHTHISFHRDAIKAGRDQTALFRRYLTYIGILEDDMTPEQLLSADVLPWVDGAQYSVGGALYDTAKRVIELRDGQARMEAALTLLAGRDFTDEPAIVAGVLAGLSPEAIAAAIPAGIARQVADELATRLAS